MGHMWASSRQSYWIVKGSVTVRQVIGNCVFCKKQNASVGQQLTLSLPRSSIDDLVFSVFTSNFFKLSYKISLLKNRFVTLFFIRFSQKFQKITLISSRIG